ncbi:hypothetical protein BDL97_09G006800 [Sphagnum fallax]|nr:hypothetical protein BDL97_09G006800 [Sphagnum fallax]
MYITAIPTASFRAVVKRTFQHWVCSEELGGCGKWCMRARFCRNPRKLATSNRPCGREVRDDALLLRFIRELSFNIEEAAKAIAKHQEWRASFLPNGYILESEISGELNAKKSYLQGQDRKGHPILLILGCKHVPNKEDFEEFKRFIVYAIEKAIKVAPADGKLVGIIDLKDYGFKNLDSRGFIAGFDILQSHYPQRVEKLFMVNVPLIFNGLWKVVSPFIKDAVREKIVFVDNKKLQETLLADIDADQLPSDYGGSGELILLQDAAVPNWPPVTQ